MSDQENEDNEKPFPKDSQVEENNVNEDKNDEDNNFPEEQNNESGNEQKNNKSGIDNDFDAYMNNINNSDNENNNKENENGNEENQQNEEEEKNDENNHNNSFPEKGENNDDDDFVEVENNEDNNNNIDNKNEENLDDINNDTINNKNEENEEKLDDTYNYNNNNNNKENSFRFSNEQKSKVSNFPMNLNDKENEFEYENENNNKEDNKTENENEKNNNTNNSFGFRDSDLKNNNNINNNQYDNDSNNNNKSDNNFRLSGNSDNMNMNLNNKEEDESPNKFNLNSKKDNNTNNKSINNNFLKKSNNNNFNYAKNPYNSINNNNYSNNYNNNNNNNSQNPNGGFSYNNNTNQTSANFIPQDTPITANLNYGYSSNYNPPKLSHHNQDYDSYYEKFTQNPEDSDGLHIDPSKRGEDSSTVAGIQIANTIMGAGILSIPIVMSYLGIIIGSLLVVFLAITTLYTVYLLIRCHQITGKSGYSMFGKITMGKPGNIIVKIMIIINNLGICICYLRIFGEVFQTIFQSFVSEDSFFVTNWHNFFYILIGSFIMFFFIFIKNISALKKVSYLGVIAALSLTLMMIVLLLYESIANELDSDVTWKYLIPNCTFAEAFHAAPTVFVAFLFQFNAFPVYYNLKNRGMRSMMKATRIGVVYSLIIFLIVGIIGFLLYGFNIDDTILDNFSDDMLYYKGYNIFPVILIIIICLTFILTCLTSFPVLFLSLRVNYINGLKVCKNDGHQSDPRVEIVQGQYEKKRTMVSEKFLNFITIALFLFIVIVAIIVPNLKPVFVAVGSIAGTFIGFILPSIFYIIIMRTSGKKESLVLPFMLLGFGVFFLIICIFMAFF